MNDLKKEIVYNLLQSKYLEIFDYGEFKIDEIINDNSIFPDFWFALKIDKRIEILSYAIKNKLNLNFIINEKDFKNVFFRY